MHPDALEYPIPAGPGAQVPPNKASHTGYDLDRSAAGVGGQEGGGGSAVLPPSAAATGSGQNARATNGLTDQEVSVFTGFPIETIRVLRKKSLKRGDHWVVRGRAAVWTASGVDALKKIAVQKGATGPLGARRPSEPSQDATQSTEKPPWRQQQAAWRVWRSGYRNPRVVACVPVKAPDPQNNDDLTFIRVRDSKNFVRGMILEALEEKPGVWALNGRLPRWRGKW